MTDAKFNRLLAKQHRLTNEANVVHRELSRLIIARYGTHYSDVDCDQAIDSLDYPNAPPITLEELDIAMANVGKPKLDIPFDPDDYGYV